MDVAVRALAHVQPDLGIERHGLRRVDQIDLFAIHVGPRLELHDRNRRRLDGSTEEYRDVAVVVGAVVGDQLCQEPAHATVTEIALVVRCGVFLRRELDLDRHHHSRLHRGAVDGGRDREVHQAVLVRRLHPRVLDVDRERTVVGDLHGHLLVPADRHRRVVDLLCDFDAVGDRRGERRLQRAATATQDGHDHGG